MTIADMVERLKNLNIKELASEVAEQRKEAINNQIRIQLEQQHTSGNNLKIGVYESKKYVRWKNKQPDISPFFNSKDVDLFLTGAFQKKIRTSVNGDEYDITSDDKKTEFLKERYGSEILELSDESKSILK
ncbi:MAG: hypothetical protein LBC89_05810, partial [Bacteroidales bacterium]|nr:hypothetical protein [Bacteroidales bacterium]